MTAIDNTTQNKRPPEVDTSRLQEQGAELLSGKSLDTRGSLLRDEKLPSSGFLDITPLAGLKGSGSENTDSNIQTPAVSQGMTRALEALAPEKMALLRSVASLQDYTTHLFSMERISSKHTGILESPLPLKFSNEQRDEAVEAARKSGKLLVAFVGAPAWCHWCTKLDAEVAPLEKQLNGKAVFAHIDSDTEGGESWKSPQIDSVPQIRIFRVDSNGQKHELKSISGFQPASEILGVLMKYGIKPPAPRYNQLARR